MLMQRLIGITSIIFATWYATGTPGFYTRAIMLVMLLSGVFMILDDDIF